MTTPVLNVPSEIVVMLTFPAGVTGELLLANIPPASNALSMMIGATSAALAIWVSDQTPCTTKDPGATVANEVVMDVLAAGAEFVVSASGWADCFTLNHDAA